MFLNLDKQKKDKIAVVDNEGHRLSYRELIMQIDDVGRHFTARSLIFVLCRNTAGSLAGYLAAVEHNAVPLLLNASIDRELLNGLIDIYSPAFLWVPSDDTSLSRYKTVYEKLDYKLLATGHEPYSINENLQLCMATSGSTGSPKLVRYMKGNLEASAANVAEALGWTDRDRGICDLGMQYTMGLNVINSHLCTGATVLLTTYNLMSADFWEYVKTERGTNFTGVPFSYDILWRLHFDRMELPELKTLCQGGGKLTEQRFVQIAEFAQKSGKRFIATYGTTETSSRAACLPSDLSLEKICSIGKAIPGCELLLVDQNGTVIEEPDVEGELCVAGPTVTMGYAECKNDLLKGDEFGGKYYTGDLARRDADGCYYITGRKKRFLKLLSYRISLDQVEKLIQEEFECECACTGNDKRLNIYITENSKAADVQDYISSKTGLFRNLFRVIPVKEIIRNEGGKIQYNLMDENAGIK